MTEICTEPRAWTCNVGWESANVGMKKLFQNCYVEEVTYIKNKIKIIRENN